MMAIAITAIDAYNGPFGPAAAISEPPSIMPSRIDSDVPISTKPLPPTSSSLRNACGRIAYLIGPNSVECNPIKNRTLRRIAASCRKNPKAATDIAAISKSLTNRMTRVFSNFSAICPADAENRKNGRMNNAGAMFEYVVICSVDNPISKPMSSTVALRNTLSLNAPSACVMKNGRKRRSRSN